METHQKIICPFGDDSEGVETHKKSSGYIRSRMVPKPQEPFCDQRFSKLGFKIFEHNFWYQNVTFGMIFLSEKTKKQENVL